MNSVTLVADKTPLIAVFKGEFKDGSKPSVKPFIKTEIASPPNRNISKDNIKVKVALITNGQPAHINTLG